MYSLDDIRLYREKYGRKKLVLDANLLILLLVGVFDKNVLRNCQSTKKYCGDDFDLMIKIFQYFESEIIITPHILAEISNLCRRDIKQPRISRFFVTVVDKLKNCKEEYIPLKRLLGIKISTLVSYGFPDMSIIEAAKTMDAVVFTDDLVLCSYADSFQIANICFSRIVASDSMVNKS